VNLLPDRVKAIAPAVSIRQMQFQATIDREQHNRAAASKRSLPAQFSSSGEVKFRAKVSSS
jgi:hypothetical protein